MIMDPNEIQKKLSELAPDKQLEVLKYIDSLRLKNESKKKQFLDLGWAGGLKDLKDEYTSVELQKESHNWRN